MEAGSPTPQLVSIRDGDTLEKTNDIAASSVGTNSPYGRRRFKSAHAYQDPVEKHIVLNNFNSVGKMRQTSDETMSRDEEVNIEAAKHNSLESSKSLPMIATVAK